MDDSAPRAFLSSECVVKDPRCSNYIMRLRDFLTTCFGNAETSLSSEAMTPEMQGLTTEMKGLREELKTEMKGLTTEMKGLTTEMKGLREDLTTEMKGLREDLTTEMQKLNTNFETLIKEIRPERTGECSICLEDFDPQRGPIAAMRCRHKYHEKCLQEWREVSKLCPLCRKPSSFLWVCQ